MWKVIKYKILTLLEDKWFKFILILFFVILNYSVFINSGMLSAGNQDFNKTLKYTLLINNFTTTSMVSGQLVAIYIGSSILGNDILTGKLYIILTSFPRRWKYLLGNYIGLVLVMFSFIATILVNYFVCSITLDVAVNYIDLFHCFGYILLNMLVMLTIAIVFSIIIPGKGSWIICLLALIFFNVYTYSYIPFINKVVFLHEKTRRLFACIVPMTEVAPPSIYSDGSLSRYYVKPLLINNMIFYQLIYVGVLFIIATRLFKNKEL